MLKKYLSVIALLSFLSACAVDTTGILPSSSEGQRYTVDCGVVFLDEMFGMQIPRQIDATIEVCSADEPALFVQEQACDVLVETGQEVIRMSYPMATAIQNEGPINLDLVADGDCLVDFSGPGYEIDTASIRSGLHSGVEYSTLLNNSGRVLAKSSLNTQVFNTESSTVSMGVKLLSWRYGVSQAHGSLEFDRFNCINGAQCDLLVRSFEFDVDDFKIVRPTIFAADVKMEDIRLYSLNSYYTSTDHLARFNLSNVRVIALAKVDGEQQRVIGEFEVSINGEFSDPLQEQQHASQGLVLHLSGSTPDYTLNAELQMRNEKFVSKLFSFASWRCLSNVSYLYSSLSARVRNCGVDAPLQAWAVEKRGSYVRLRDALHSHCLNVKTSSQNREGGMVGIVNCSNHSDQLWRLTNDWRLIHARTGKCLNLDSSEFRDGGKVNIRSCNGSVSQQWFLYGVLAN